MDDGHGEIVQVQFSRDRSASFIRRDRASAIVGSMKNGFDGLEPSAYFRIILILAVSLILALQPRNMHTVYSTRFHKNVKKPQEIPK